MKCNASKPRETSLAAYVDTLRSPRGREILDSPREADRVNLLAVDEHRPVGDDSQLPMLDAAARRPPAQRYKLPGSSQ